MFVVVQNNSKEGDTFFHDRGGYVLGVGIWCNVVVRIYNWLCSKLNRVGRRNDLQDCGARMNDVV